MKKILIVDDDKIFRKVLKDGLLAHGKEEYKVEIAADGKEGIAFMRDDKPDLVVLDMLMPNMDGVTTLIKMKKDESLKDIPVLISTQVSDVEQMSKAVELGVKGYIIKSELSLDNIIMQVEDALKKES